MPISRLSGVRRETSLPSTRMRPEVGFSKPAIMRSVVVLPQPDGPSSVTNEPPPNASDTSSTATHRLPLGRSELLREALQRHRRRRGPAARHVDRTSVASGGSATPRSTRVEEPMTQYRNPIAASTMTMRITQ